MAELTSSSTQRTPEAAPPRRAVQLPFDTIGKILLVAFLIWAFLKLATVITLVLVAIVLAIALEPLVEYLERLRLPRWAAATLVVLLGVAAIGVFLAISGASLATQGRLVGTRLLEIETDLVGRMPPFIAGAIGRGSASQPDASVLAGYAVAVGAGIANALLLVVIASILTLYLLIDGRRTWEWVVAYVPPRNRQRAQVTAEAARRAVQSYVAGNAATSASGCFTCRPPCSWRCWPASAISFRSWASPYPPCRRSCWP